MQREQLESAAEDWPDQIYDLLNQPALGNDRFLSDSGWDGMALWRNAMACAACKASSVRPEAPEEVCAHGAADRAAGILSEHEPAQVDA